ncbi:MAG: hypothetical protein O2904_01955 [bacterium]|nr:hypothetical protein [bacterium]
MHIRTFDVSLNDGVDSDVIQQKFGFQKDIFGRSTDSLSLESGSDGQTAIAARVSVASYTMLTKVIDVLNHFGKITNFTSQSSTSEVPIAA